MVHDEYSIVAMLRTEAPHLHVTLENLKSLKVDVLAEVYRWFVLQILDCKESALDEVQFNIAHLLENVEHFLNSVPVLQLTLTLDLVGYEGGYNHLESLTIQNIIEPTRQRTLHLLSFLMDLYLFCRKRNTEFFDNCIETEAAMVQDKLAIKERNEHLKEWINSSRVALEEKNISTRQLMEKKEARTKMCQKQQEKIDVQKQTLDKEEQVQRELASATNALKEEYSRLSSRNKLLISSIVPSPGQIVQDLSDCSDAKKQNKEKIDALNTNYSLLKAKLVDMPKLDRTLDILLESASKIFHDLESLEALCLSLEEGKEKIRHARLNANRRQQLISDVKEDLNSRAEKCSKLTTQLNLRLREMENEVAEVKRKVAAYEQEKGQNRVAAIHLDEESQELVQKIGKLTEEHRKITVKCHEKREHLTYCLSEVLPSKLSDFCSKKKIINK